ncbi:MAG: hypothetical protein S4CHLAM7_01130 [Chlamydiae bacterium]|nr:hypothetical protein [Chlamydiota bacterium]
MFIPDSYYGSDYAKSEISDLKPDPEKKGPSLLFHIEGGEYAFDQNILILKVKRQTLDESGDVTSEKMEEVCYEIVELNLKDSKNPSSLQVLGLRSEAVMKAVMTVLIDQFKELKDAEPFLGTQFDPICKEELKTVKISKNNASNDPRISTFSLEIFNSYLSENSWVLDEQKRDRFKTSELKSVNLASLLNPQSWGSMLEQSKTVEDRKHFFTLEASHLESSKPLVEKATSLLFDEEKGKSSLFLELKKEIQNNYYDQKGTLSLFLRRYKRLEDQLSLQLEKATLKKEDTIIGQLNSQLATLQKLKKRTHDKLKNLILSADLVLFAQSKKLEQQYKSPGDVSFTEFLSKNWYSKLLAFGLFEEESSIEENLRDKVDQLKKENFDDHIKSINAQLNKLTPSWHLPLSDEVEDLDTDVDWDLVNSTLSSENSMSQSASENYFDAESIDSFLDLEIQLKHINNSNVMDPINGGIKPSDFDYSMHAIDQLFRKESK